MTLFEDADKRLLAGFERRNVQVEGQDILTLVGGEGPPLLMLHGDPQTHLCWHLVAPDLAKSFTVIMTDIRGRGEGSMFPPTADHAPYSKRAMAEEQLRVMQSLGFDRFRLVGHDRGARVARRLALDHPHAVERLAVLDIIPALDFYEHFSAELAQDYFYFNFLTQPAPQPENLISGDPEAFMRTLLLGLSDDAVAYHPLALEAYISAATRPASIAAMCECFRAGFTVDRQHDVADRKAGQKIACPTLVLWGEKGIVSRHFDMRAVWRRWCLTSEFAAMPSGHFIPEEAPRELLKALAGFLR